MSVRSTQLFLVAAGTLLLALGIPILVAALNVREYSVQYDDAGPMAGLTNDERQAALLAAGDVGVTYPVDIVIQDEMKPPVRIAPTLLLAELASMRAQVLRNALLAATAAC